MRLRHALLLIAALAAAPLADAAVIGGDVRDAVVTLEHVSDAPGDFQLSAPRPNPFTSQARLDLTVDVATDLTVAVYDALGRRVALIHEGTVRPGTYSLRIQAADLPNGLYLVRASDGRGTTATRSIALVR